MRAIDAELNGPAELVLIGGTALSFYARSHSTLDVDYINRPSSLVFEAINRLKKKGIPTVLIQYSGVYSAPEDYNARLRPAFDPPLAKLQVLIPERHDLAIMKIARGYEHDLAGVVGMHVAQPLDAEILYERFAETVIIGSREMVKIGFLEVVATMFGEEAAAHFSRRLALSP